MPIKYDDNGAVKRPNKEIALTREMVEEFAMCAQDVVHFAENHYWIINPVTGEQRIELYEFQKKILRNLQDNRFNILLAARQVGKCIEFHQCVEILNTETGETKKNPIGEFFESIDIESE